MLNGLLHRDVVPIKGSSAERSFSSRWSCSMLSLRGGNVLGNGEWNGMPEEGKNCSGEGTGLLEKAKGCSEEGNTLGGKNALGEKGGSCSEDGNALGGEGKGCSEVGE